jgi:acetyltransferase AlgX (SGNH hydrolase-like protein)
MRAFVIAFLVVFFALCALPLAARFGQFGPSSKLRGAVAPPAEVALSARSYFDGTFQKAFEENFNAALGFRAALVRSDNELNFRVFKEFIPSPGTAMILGKNRFVYERQYVDAHNRRNLVPASQLEREVQRLKLLQDYVKDRQSTLLVVISPNKASIYSEYLPRRFVYDERVALPDNYTVFVGLLRKYGVNLLDVQGSMAASKASSPLPFFSNSGAHWNDPSACSVASEIQEFIRRELQIPSLGLGCERYVMRDGPTGSDRDLSDLANLWFEEELFQPTPYAQARTIAHGKLQRPSVLYVGSSFLWQILDYENHYGLQQRDTFFYYYKARVAYPGRKRTALEPEHVDWQRDVFAKQAIVIEINAAVVEHVGWGFLADAERVILGG